MDNNCNRQTTDGWIRTPQRLPQVLRFQQVEGGHFTFNENASIYMAIREFDILYVRVRQIAPPMTLQLNTPPPLPTSSRPQHPPMFI